MDNARCSEVTGLSDKFTNLHRLSIVNAGLVSLKGFPSLVNLQEVHAKQHCCCCLLLCLCVWLQLQLGDNKLSGGLGALSECLHLSQLGLAGNKIGEIEDLKPLV